jgi:hypothetical protein
MVLGTYAALAKLVVVGVGVLTIASFLGIDLASMFVDSITNWLGLPY